MTTAENIRVAEIYPASGKARPTVQDSRHLYGMKIPCMSLPYCEDIHISRRRRYETRVAFVHPDSGYPHDRDNAARFLKAGHIYHTSHITISQSSSQVELKEFPGIAFNTVLFADWKDMNDDRA